MAKKKLNHGLATKAINSAIYEHKIQIVPSYGKFPYEQFFKAALLDMENMRSELWAPVVPERLINYAIRILDAKTLEEAEKLTADTHSKAEVAFLAQWAKGEIPGPMTVDGQVAEAKKLEKLAEFIDRQGNPEKAAQMKLKAHETRNVDVAANKFRPKQEIDMSKFTEAQQKIISQVRHAGNAVTLDALTGNGASPEDIKFLLGAGILVNPREGVYRLEEKALVKTEQPAPKGVKKTKTPKEPKPKKEKAAKEAKPPKERKPKLVINPSEKCLCGCGGAVVATSRFKPGHDAKLHGTVVRASKGDKEAKFPRSELTVAYLKQAPWMTKEIAKAVDL